jgi:hypothetical protein
MAVNSNNITIFPCVSRVFENENSELSLKAKLMSEENITNMIKSITDNKSFVIEYDNTYNLFKLILNGYYIELTELCENTKYVRLVYQDTSSTHILIKGDKISEGLGGVFEGVEILKTTPSDEKDWLCLCKDGEIPTESYQKFDTKSMSFDFGELK